MAEQPLSRPSNSLLSVATEEFTCQLCKHTLTNPVVTTTCEHIYCQVCIDKHLQGSKTCPIDHQPLHEKDLVKPFKSFVNLLIAYKQDVTSDYSSIEGSCPSPISSSSEISEHTLNENTLGLPIPSWLEELRNNSKYTQIRVKEWDDLTWRSKHGWNGRDYCHNVQSSGVNITEYYWNKESKMLVGLVFFGPEAESHQGHCHGGAMCAVMDDLVGWTAFMTNNNPWGGATAQVNVSLRKAVPVGSLLKLEGKVLNKEGRKTWVHGSLSDGKEAVYAEVEGLAISLKTGTIGQNAPKTL